MWPVLLPTNKGWDTHVTPERSKTVWTCFIFPEIPSLQDLKAPYEPKTTQSIQIQTFSNTPGVKQTVDEPYSNNQPDVYTSVATLARWVIEQIEMSIMDRTVSRNRIQPSRSLDKIVQHCVISCEICCLNH